MEGGRSGSCSSPSAPQRRASRFDRAKTVPGDACSTLNSDCGRSTCWLCGGFHSSAEETHTPSDRGLVLVVSCRNNSKTSSILMVHLLAFMDDVEAKATPHNFFFTSTNSTSRRKGTDGMVSVVRNKRRQYRIPMEPTSRRKVISVFLLLACFMRHIASQYTRFHQKSNGRTKVWQSGNHKAPTTHLVDWWRPELLEATARNSWKPSPVWGDRPFCDQDRPRINLVGVCYCARSRNDTTRSKDGVVTRWRTHVVKEPSPRDSLDIQGKVQ